jgi:hypothetical protein
MVSGLLQRSAFLCDRSALFDPLWTWWVNSGTDFDPDNTVPVGAGGFVRGVARTPHYDGVKKTATEPAVIALFGLGPVDLKLVDPSQPSWRSA